MLFAHQILIKYARGRFRFVVVQKAQRHLVVRSLQFVGTTQ